MMVRNIVFTLAAGVLATGCSGEVADFEIPDSTWVKHDADCRSGMLVLLSDHGLFYIDQQNRPLDRIFRIDRARLLEASSQLVVTEFLEKGDLEFTLDYTPNTLRLVEIRRDGHLIERTRNQDAGYNALNLKRCA